MARRITCYTDEDGCPISSEGVVDFYKLDIEYCGWYIKDNTYESECKTIALSKEELEEYIRKIKK